MIQYSVRWAVPFIYLVVAASALPVLYPGDASRWLLRNRRYIGLIFAVAMAWQGAFIFQMSAFHSEYYYNDVYVLRDELEGSSGYLFLAAMVITSFHFTRRHLSQTQWKLIHKSGTYFLFAYPFSVYWWNLYYYSSPAPIDHLFYWTGFLAFAARIAAWGKKRHMAASVAGGGSEGSNNPMVFRVLGILLIAGALLGAPTGLCWQGAASEFLTSTEWSAQLELWLPFWPFEPFLPLLALGLGTLLLTYPRRLFTKLFTNPCIRAVGSK
jgi:DMSO/TMAO reductase YedYZ heme-binding membrane subunit